MFGIGMPEFLLIMAVALIVLGPKRLPELARSLGKGLAEFKKSTEELKGNLNLDDDLQEVRENLKEMVDPSSYLETAQPLPSASGEAAMETAAQPAPEISPPSSTAKVSDV